MLLARLLGLFEQHQEGPSLGSDSKTSELVDLLVSVRRMARDAKQFAIADHIRDELGAMGIVLEDRQDGTGWRVQ
jgi:cysteinyl-tRNA synthetase